jgi:chromosomal replication initiation ATPase DnaA
MITDEINLCLCAKAVANFYKIKPKEIFIRSRKIEKIHYRCMFVGLAKYYNRTLSPHRVLFTNAAIGLYAYNKFKFKVYDHTTILNTTKRFEELMETDFVFRHRFESILRICEELRTGEHQKFLTRKETLLRMIAAASCEEELKTILN